MKLRRDRLSLTLFLLLAPFMRVQAASHLTVVELYTSEGCNSCPPAEEYLGELAGRNDVLPLSFHVDYWDDLGWRDPFALASSTARQLQYSANLKLSSAFTPQAIVNGRESFIGSDRRHVSESLRTPGEALVALTLTQVDGQLVISTNTTSLREPADLLLVPFRRHARSYIGRGENRGRTLEEFNIARGIRVIGHTRDDALQLRIALDTLPKDATDVAVLAQRAHQGEIVGAARLSLTSNAQP